LASLSHKSRVHGQDVCLETFLRDQASDSEEVVTPLMLDGTYLSRNFATLGPSSLTAGRRVVFIGG
jgi:hypothetical protein